MITPANAPGVEPRNRSRSHWPDVGQAMFCIGCRYLRHCGGMCVGPGFPDCLGDCCGKPEGCVRACQKNPGGLVLAMREIGATFDFNQVVPRVRPVAAPALPDQLPLIDHRGSVSGPRALNWAAVKLRAFFLQSGATRYRTPEELRSALGLNPGASILLSGIDQDDDVEAWWALGMVQRRLLVRAMRDFGIGIVTVPNFSLALNEPRLTQMHAMSRIAIAHHEFLSNGMPAALHLGANTERDYERWAEFIAPREEVSHVAVDFTTGPARAERRNFHLSHLTSLARVVGRPLHLILKGRVDAIAGLQDSFASVTYVDTTAFAKTRQRRRLLRGVGSRQPDEPARTAPGEPLDDLWEENWVARGTFLANLRPAKTA